jgi:hypothetical protein
MDVKGKDFIRAKRLRKRLWMLSTSKYKLGATNVTDADIPFGSTLKA